jgi:hypothetical protein
MNTEIRNRTEITGFVDVITRTPERTAPKATKSNRKLFITILENDYTVFPLFSVK